MGLSIRQHQNLYRTISPYLLSHPFQSLILCFYGIYLSKKLYNIPILATAVNHRCIDQKHYHKYTFLCINNTKIDILFAIRYNAHTLRFSAYFRRHSMNFFGCGYNFRHDANFKAERPLGAGGHIYMIIRSPARITLDGKDHFVKGNTVIVYRKNSPHIYGAHNAPFVNDWIRFQANDEDFAYLDSLGIKFDTIYEYPDIYDLSLIVKMLAEESRFIHKNSQEIIASLLRVLFLKLSDCIAKKPLASAHLTEKMLNLRNSIYSSPQNNWSIEGICQSLSISPSYLQHKYKAIFGNSIKNDITASRLEYGKYLLTNTDNTVRDIAQMIGYENDVHFMYMFKKKTGYTPSQYRDLAIVND